MENFQTLIKKKTLKPVFFKHIFSLRRIVPFKKCIMVKGRAHSRGDANPFIPDVTKQLIMPLGRINP